jgi:hypothetical protein
MFLEHQQFGQFSFPATAEDIFMMMSGTSVNPIYGDTAFMPLSHRVRGFEPIS